MPSIKDYAGEYADSIDAAKGRAADPYKAIVAEAMKRGSSKPSLREDVLSEASLLTSGDRNKSYGPPARNLERAAAMLRAYFGDRPIQSATSADFAAINVIIKLARVATNPTHRDSWVDMAAYAAIGYECAVDVANSQGKDQKEPG